MVVILKDLYKSNFVLGEGPVPCEIFIVGEAPGKDEDTWQRPFIGRAGTVLTRLLNNARIKRSEVYITNAVKQRPPENRKPFMQEIRAHRPFLLEEIKLVKPKVIVLLGKTALEAFCGYEIKETIGSFRERRGRSWKMMSGAFVIATYHPASILYGGDSTPMLNDFKKIKLLLKGANNETPRKNVHDSK